MFSRYMFNDTACVTLTCALIINTLTVILAGKTQSEPWSDYQSCYVRVHYFPIYSIVDNRSPFGFLIGLC